MSNKHQSAPDIEAFLLEVFGLQIDLTGVRFPKKEGVDAYMVSADCIPLSTQQMWDKVIAWAKPKNHFQVWGTLSTGIFAVQPLKVFAHRGGDESDTNHRNKSYDDAKAEKLDFVDVRDYILITAFHKWKHGHWMDLEGWTRIDGLWPYLDVSDVCTVCGHFDHYYAAVYLRIGYRRDHGPASGVRERFWA